MKWGQGREEKPQPLVSAPVGLRRREAPSPSHLRPRPPLLMPPRAARLPHAPPAPAPPPPPPCWQGGRQPASFAAWPLKRRASEPLDRVEAAGQRAVALPAAIACEPAALLAAAQPPRPAAGRRAAESRRRRSPRRRRRRRASDVSYGAPLPPRQRCTGLACLVDSDKAPAGARPLADSDRGLGAARSDRR